MLIPDNQVLGDTLRVFGFGCEGRALQCLPASTVLLPSNSAYSGSPESKTKNIILLVKFRSIV